MITAAVLVVLGVAFPLPGAPVAALPALGFEMHALPDDSARATGHRRVHLADGQDADLFIGAVNERVQVVTLQAPGLGTTRLPSLAEALGPKCGPSLREKRDAVCQDDGPSAPRLRLRLCGEALLISSPEGSETADADLLCASLAGGAPGTPRVGAPSGSKP